MEKHYTRTVDINVLVGNLPNPQDTEGLRRQIDLIESEIEEGKANLGLIQSDPEALRDDVMDILFTTYGLAGRMDLSYRYLFMFTRTGKTKFSEVAELIVGQLPSEIDRSHVAKAGLDSLTQTLSNIREHIEIDLDYSKALVPHLILCGYLLAHGLGYPTDEDYEEVIRSNLSKFDEDLDDVEATKAKYKALGVDIAISEESYLNTAMSRLNVSTWLNRSVTKKTPKAGHGPKVSG